MMTTNDLVRFMTERFDRLDAKIDNGFRDFEKRLDEVEKTQEICKAKCEGKLDITKTRLTVWGSVITALVTGLSFILSKIF